MHEPQNNEKNFREDQSAEIPQKPGHSTGPRSPEGKANSSMNSLRHGCRSEILILPFEDPAEFEFTLESWTSSYDPQEPTAATLVYETAKAQWFFERNQKRLAQIEAHLPADAWHWTDENIKLFNNFSRYKTTAERSFYRAFNTLEAWYKRRAAREERAHRAIDARCAREERARAQMAKIQVQWLANQAKNAADDMKTIQAIEVVTNTRGECVTTCSPTNEYVASLASSAHPPKFVTRFLFFDFGVPPAYNWLNPNHVQRTERSIGIQQFTFSDWLKQVEAEKQSAAGHLLPFHTALLSNPE